MTRALCALLVLLPGVASAQPDSMPSLTGQPGDPAFDQFYESQFPSIVDFAKQQEINTNALVALLDKIGPSILLTHSQSGAFGWPVADRRPALGGHIAGWEIVIFMEMRL